MIEDFSKPQNPTIWIGKKETTTELLGQTPKNVKYLCVYCDNKAADLSLLKDYPNVEILFLNGDFANVDDISRLKSLNALTIRLTSNTALNNLFIPTLKSLSVYNKFNDGFENLLSEDLEYLELMDIRGLFDLSFVKKLSGLKKLYLESLPAVERLPDFEKIPNLYGLKIYELHKLNDIESLTRSNIRFLSLTLAADKLSGTKLAEVLLSMGSLERLSCMLDRSGKRDDVLENRLNKAGRLDIWDNFDMSEWLRL